MLNPVTDAFLDGLKSDLPAAAFRPVSAAYLEEPRGRYKGQAGAVIAPATVDQVAAVIRACNAARIGVVPYGGGTGLVGGQIVEDGPAPLILSLERMTAIRAVHPRENVIVAEAGAILQSVQQVAEAADRLFPLSMASEGSARIGGMLSTNAGGIGVLRYGTARALCLGVEAVLPDGQVLHGLTRLRKDNTGYALRDLLIGAEGTLGVITAAALKLAPRPRAAGTALLIVPDPQAALDLLALTGDIAGAELSAFELIGRTGLEFLSETMPDMRQPFADPPEWMVLVELGLGEGRDPQAVLEQIFTAGSSAGLVEDGLIAQTGTQRNDFWALREHIPLANKKIGSISSHDVALPLEAIPEFIAQAPGQLAKIGPFRVNCFGHLGDGNLHYNVFPPKGRDRAAFDADRAAVKRCVHDLVHAMGGSVSAEHGIGRLKTGDLARYGDATKLSAMRTIKAALDPAGIMNPGAVLPA